MSLFPLFLKLDGRRCVVIGAGKIGEPKIESLLSVNAKVVVVAPEATATVQGWAQSGVITWKRAEFEPADLEGAFLVIASTSSKDVNGDVFLEAQKRGILCNSVDDPEHCDFFYPAIVRRGDFQIAISTGGNSPALAQRLRSELETQFGPEYAGWVNELGRVREQLFSAEIDPEKRRQLLHEIASEEAFQAVHSRSQA